MSTDTGMSETIMDMWCRNITRYGLLMREERRATIQETHPKVYPATTVPRSGPSGSATVKHGHNSELLVEHVPCPTELVQAVATAKAAVERPVRVPATTVTAIIRNDNNQLLFVMGTDSEWVLPWGPITISTHNDHGVYSPHEMDSMMSLAGMLLSTLGVHIKSCQWALRPTGVCRHNGEDYEVTLVDYPVVDGVKIMWY